MEREYLMNCRGKKSWQEAANDLNITAQMLGMLERGDRTPSLELAKKISEYYNEPIEKLFLLITETKYVYKIKRRLSK